MQDLVLYHYTSQKGFLGIISKKTLWASSIRYLNDSLEFSYLFDLLDREMRKMSKITAKLDIEFLVKVRATLAATKAQAPFVASFSADGDLLSQWRAYTPCPGGLAVGFFRSSLAQLSASQDYDLQQCIYNVKWQREVVRNLLDDLLEHRGAITIDLFNELIAFHAPSFKHSSFEEEHEWRLVSQKEDAQRREEFREGQSMLIPYRKVDLSELSALGIAEVVVGPTPHMQEAALAVTQYLSSKDLSTVKTRPSEIPFRNW